MVAVFDSPALRKQSASHTAKHLRRRRDNLRVFDTQRVDSGPGGISSLGGWTEDRDAVLLLLLPSFRSAVCQSGRTGSLQDGGRRGVWVCVKGKVKSTSLRDGAERRRRGGGWIIASSFSHPHQAASLLQIFTQRCCSTAARVKKVGLYT